jgi:hypothetical protein
MELTTAQRDRAIFLGTAAGKTGFTKPRPQHVRRRGPEQRQALVVVQ